MFRVGYFRNFPLQSLLQFKQDGGVFRMEKYGKWLAFDRLGEGGQGTVYLAHDTSKVNVRAAVGAIRAAIGQIAGPVSEGAKIDNAKNMAERIAEYVKSLDTANYGALKLLHPSKDDAEFVRQLGRMRDEIAALRGLSHPNVVKLL